MSARKSTVFLLLPLAATGILYPSHAQEHPNQARGIRPETAFSTGGLDTVNGMNGGLSLSIPLGQSYPMNGGWSYSFGLHYSSNFWKFNSVNQNAACGGGSAIEAIVDPHFNAGIGWTFGLGRLFSPGDTGFNESGRWVYVDPSGGRHTFYNTLHEGESASTGWFYTRDNSYLRLNSAARLVELPNGLRHFFSTTTYLSRIEDRFGNYLDVTYTPPAAGGGSTATWTLTDSLGRQQSAVFTRLGGGRGVHLTSLSLKSFGGGTATYSFEYDPGITAIPRTDKDTSCANNSPQDASGTDWMAVALLRKITGPEGLVWSIQKPNGDADYYRPPGAGYTRSIYSGVINSLKLPTGGSLAWTWRTWTFPAGKNGYRDTSAGVASKIVTDPFGSETSGTWTYSSELCPKVPPETTTPYCNATGPRSNEVISDIRSPTGTRFIQHFTANTDDGTPGGTGGRENANWDYGLPFSCREEINPSGSRKCLSTTIYSPGPSSTRQRSNWLRFTRDKKPTTSGDPGPGTLWNLNRRVDFHRLKFDDDGSNRYRETDFASNPPTFDGLGHYRTANESAQFGTSSSRQTTTGFNKVSGCYNIDLSDESQECNGGSAFVPPLTSSRWILGIFDGVTVTENSVASKTEFYFDANTGFLDCYRVLESGTSRGPNDVYVDLSNAGSGPGYVGIEKWYGGDGAGLSTSAGCISIPSPPYQIDHTYSAGVPATSRHVGAGVSHFDLQATIDASTGLPSSLFDSAGFKTNLSYDVLGRVTSVAPVGGAGDDGDGATTSFDYDFPAGGNKTTVTWSRSCPAVASGCGEVFPQGENRFDGFGRLVQERILGPSGWANRHTDFSIQGWKLRDSELTPDGAPVHYTQYQNFDPLGRARRSVAPDGKETNFVFYGERQLDRKVWVATNLTGAETEFTTTYVWDGFGRLRSVTEPSGSANGSVVTTYSYDVGSRLSSVSTPTGAGGNQVRSFKYDNRGFLKFEKHPEKDAPFPDGAGGLFSLAYLYDARGNVTSIKDGSASDWLKLTYDKAERLTQVRDGAVGDRLIKQLTYDTGSSGFALSKVTKTERWNYFDDIAMTVLATQTQEYQGVEGRPSARNTTATFNGVLGETFPQTFSWSRNGELASQTYPRCTGGGCPGGGQASRTQINTFSRGFLTAVSYNGASVATLSYHGNGMLSEALHHNSAQALQKTKLVAGVDPQNMQRIGSLSYFTGTSQIANLGTFTYDGSANLESQNMGATSSKYRYDGVSRLLEAELGFGGGPYRQSYAYDRFGNIGSITTQVGGGNPSTVNTPTSLTTNRLTSGSYDASGNLKSYPSGAQEYWYDSFGLTTRVLKGSEDWRYVYTGDDERLLNYRTGGGAFTYTVRGLDGQVLRQTEPGTAFTDFVYGAGLLAKFDQANARTDYHVDHLGTPRLSINNTGGINRYYMYYPYGQEFNAPGTADTFRFRFTAHERDLLNTSGAADDTEHHHARRFSLLTARYQSPDPIGGDPFAPQSWNLFSYVEGNPINRIDPFGLDWCSYETVNDKGERSRQTFWCEGISVIDRDPGGPGGGPGGGGKGDSKGHERGRPCHDGENQRRELTTSESVASFSAGFGDALLWGFGDELRGENGSVDMSSAAYLAGNISGAIASFAAGGLQGVRAAGAAGLGLEFSHWIPARYGGARSILNGNYVSSATHALSDPYRYTFMPRTWKAANPMPSSANQQWVRIPNTIKGASAGAANAGAGIAGSGC